ncbi:SPOC-domain-containing protein [Hyaloscypha variabilis F]|uniref:Transcription factor BYE1 n=1 Tax=Hyaloscypha variabilis (strain UAMH 11265 / GT02V1 / F) TaxID=1149755 RepID=A0A2J6QXB2_HYAVF|nr:SPOC-domain-containing protein [Hyaloscypha variabilis F]
MADEPRRSVRATKGQHTKSLDLLDQPSEPKKKATKRSKKAAVEEEVEVIRCVCGAIETGDNDNEPWIACDKCGVWQHNVCVGVAVYEDDVPKTYMCEQCDPVFHKPFLDAIARGEDILGERRRAYELQKLQDEQEEALKKKGKKKGKRNSDQKSEASYGTNGKANSPAVADLKKEKKDTVARSGSTKRKARDDEAQDSSKEPVSKVRKVSSQPAQPAQPTQPASPPRTLSVKILDLESNRQGSARFIHKSLLQSIPVAIKAGVFALNKGDDVTLKAERLAVEIEDAVHNTHAEKNAYGKQSRAIGFNLKQNQELTNGLLTRSLTPYALASMTSDDMASKELKRETAEMKARSDKQAIMVSDDGPRIRRTHKGDEMVEEDNFAVPNDSTMSTSRRRSMIDPNAEMAARSRENSPGEQVELPDSIDDHRSRDDIRGHAVPKYPLNIDTKAPQPVRKPSGSADFDINKVFSSVQSPLTAHHARRQSTNNAPPSQGPGVDPEIDKLLQDDEGNESPPYSPAEYSSDPEIIWRGAVTMDSIAKFPAVAKHIGGADISQTIPWSDILQKDLRVAGRIDQEKANEYLCSLRYSPPTDVVVVNVTPTGEAAAQGFSELYDYFQSKTRYGVLTNKGVGNIRDTYLVPIPPNPGNLPDFIINLEGHRVPEVRPEPMILVALVIRHENHSAPPQGSEGAAESQSPSMIGHPQRQMSMSGPAPAMSPIAPQGSFQGPPPHLVSQSPMPDEAARRQQQEQQRLHDQQVGEVNARGILGEFVDAPTVAFLMPQAYQMRPVEWQVIRRILAEDEKARVDLQHLSQVLEVRMAEESQAPPQA